MLTSETIRTASEFLELTNHRQVILHIDVGWAIQAVQSRPVVLQFREAIESDLQMKDVVFRRIDCTEQEGELWDALKTWLESQNWAHVRLMTDGYGAVVWIRDGRAVDSIGDAKETGVKALVARTHDAFVAGK